MDSVELNFNNPLSSPESLYYSFQKELLLSWQTTLLLVYL